MKKIEVNAYSKAYPVYYGRGIFEKLNSLIKSYNLYKNIFIIVDENVHNHHSEKIDLLISKTEGKVGFYSLVANEINKSHFQLNDIYSALIENEFGRDTLIIAIGGGITGDLAGFVASTFCRGVQIVHVPTSLLAMVDSSIGGKTGINFESTKNIIGTFYQPDFVLIDLDFLSTLPEEEFVCGLGEIIKYSFLVGNEFLRKLTKGLKKYPLLNAQLLISAIETCVRFKANVIEKDEREEIGLRKILNLGHTFAHAIEVESEYKIKHGQSVILGLACSLYLSKKLNIIDEKLFNEYLSLLNIVKGEISLSLFDAAKIYEIMKRDKKSLDDKIKFVLINKENNIMIDVEAPSDLVIKSINDGLNHFLVK